MYHLWRRGSETVCWGQICNLGENACGYIPQFGRGIFRPNEGWSLKSFQLSSNGFHISTFPKCYKYISHVWRKTLFCREIIFVNLNYLTCTVFKRDLWVVSFLCVVFKVKVISRHPFSSGGLPGVKFESAGLILVVKGFCTCLKNSTSGRFSSIFSWSQSIVLRQVQDWQSGVWRLKEFGKGFGWMLQDVPRRPIVKSPGWK